MSGADPKKELGQHWLNDELSLQAMVDAVSPTPTDVIVEIGPGQGALTDKLKATGARVIALEFDQDLVPSLRKRYVDSNVEIVEADIRTYDLSSLPSGYKICANIPYYLTSNLLRILTDTAYPPAVAALLVQKEVADKVSATARRSMLSTIVQFKYEASAGMVVPANLFTPPPKVDSKILILEQAAESEQNWDELVRLIKVGFSNPRKTLANNLASGLKLDRDAVTALLDSCNLDLNARAEVLSNQDWLTLLSNSQG